MISGYPPGRLAAEKLAVGGQTLKQQFDRVRAGTFPCDLSDRDVTAFIAAGYSCSIA
jgi:hypothetical protein